jgi:beta-glucosidase
MVAMSDAVKPEPALPADMTFGTATASWQVEGDVAGRGHCIWDDFAATPGAIVDGTTGEPACDHLTRFDEDLDLLTWLGVDAYRMSISWPRVQPTGMGPVSEAGLATYDRMIDGLLERGIDPVVTLYHWDLPSELPGWTSRETAERFADYAEAVGARLGDRVSHWATLNEPWVSAYLGYAAGVHAPGRRAPADAVPVRSAAIWSYCCSRARTMVTNSSLFCSCCAISPSAREAGARNSSTGSTRPVACANASTIAMAAAG